MTFSDHPSVRPIVCKHFVFSFSSQSPEPPGPFPTNLYIEHPWVKGIEIYSTKGLYLHLSGFNLDYCKGQWKAAVKEVYIKCPGTEEFLTLFGLFKVFLLRHMSYSSNRLTLKYTCIYKKWMSDIRYFKL